jgi:hypothetical protein
VRGDGLFFRQLVVFRDPAGKCPGDLGDRALEQSGVLMVLGDGRPCLRFELFPEFVELVIFAFREDRVDFHDDAELLLPAVAQSVKNVAKPDIDRRRT